ncbi:hypothetical protein PAMC26510_36955 [Caballeronia sordidicola]|uniref:Uncharacterized protein n=1 Tax=Caballeronia sordidicola TaxID=196367 RepID=A0A242M3Q6_CABSO|nr:hypothetical protein PAMC26510_36955 [Caballeronia sordidicola]
MNERGSNEGQAGRGKAHRFGSAEKASASRRFPDVREKTRLAGCTGGGSVRRSAVLRRRARRFVRTDLRALRYSSGTWTERDR